ncbi:MAG: type II secretion system protein [Myxococcales bacterium]|nr:type II secretion system protein [Myxococcales bacterium]MDP3502392.1 type II secretion system protein [Myxococcales bacterium]
MTLQRGFTLIEAMVTVAIMGIVTVGLLQAGTSARLRATERLQQERATQVLEFEAEALSMGASPDAQMELSLLAELPGSFIERSRAGRTVTVRVTWGHGRPSSRELTVFTKGAK